jgi:sugar phosphate permease
LFGSGASLCSGVAGVSRACPANTNQKLSKAGRRPQVSTATVTPEFEKATFAKVSLKLIPFLFLCYIVAFLDRVNVGFAKLQMAGDLHYSDTVYSLGAGIFFIGYFIFEVPSNVILERVGARIWIARIMITWGIISSAFMWVHQIPWGPFPGWFG